MSPTSRRKRFASNGETIWNDAPYESNAGRPYRWRESKEHPEPPYKLFKVYWAGPFEDPVSVPWSSGFVALSVRDINSGMVPWLQTVGGIERAEHVHIFAGASYDEFKQLIEKPGGTCSHLMEAKD